MHNLGDDKELDRLSREAAGSYTPPGVPDWDALSAELDKVMPVEEKKRRILFFWWLLPVLIAGGAITYWFISKNNTTIITQATVTPTVSKESTTAVVTNDPVSQEKVNEAVEVVPIEKTVAEHNNIQRNKKAAQHTTTAVSSQRQNSFPAFDKTTRNGNKDEAVPSKNGSAVNSSPSNNKATVTAINETAKKENGSIANIPSKEDAITTTVAPKETEKQKTEQAVAENITSTTENKIGSASPETPTEVTENKTAKKEITPLQARGKGFSFGALAGVDESTVKFKYGNNAGFNIGVMAGYHFNDKISAHTGVIYTEKKYKVAGPDFTAPKGSMISYYKIEDVDGNCSMWEFPVVARYTISQGKKTSVFVSTGLSTYLMKNENYNYRYYNNSGALTLRNAEYYTNNTYLLSILHLSAGFENRVSKNVSLLIEPYAKLPLGGVGFGSISLSSFGLNFFVQYRQPAKK